MYDRIKMIRDMIKEGMITADIGTDHALLPVFLIQAGKCPHVYACDISEGPLERAAETIRQYHMEEKITVIQSDGFQNVPDDTETVVLAGIGFDTAVRILDDKRTDSFKQIVLELHCDPAISRKWISKRNYYINDERFIIEKGHAYTGISINPGKKTKMDEEDIFIGPLLKERPDSAYLSWLSHELHKTAEILMKSAGYTPQAEFLQHKKRIIENYLENKKPLSLSV